MILRLAALRIQGPFRPWASASQGGGMCSDSESAGGSSESRSMDSPTASPGEAVCSTHSFLPHFIHPSIQFRILSKMIPPTFMTRTLSPVYLKWNLHLHYHVRHFQKPLENYKGIFNSCYMTPGSFIASKRLERSILWRWLFSAASGRKSFFFSFSSELDVHPNLGVKVLCLTAKRLCNIHMSRRHLKW